MAVPNLNVYLYENLTGLLRLNSGSMAYSYLDSANMPLSFSMPLSKKNYTNKACEAYFGGLLPEGKNTLKQIAKIVGASSDSTFSMIEKIGNECAGAVTITEANTKPDGRMVFELKGRRLSEKELSRMLSDLPSRPLFTTGEFRLSLAGAQEKGALCKIDGRLCIPDPGIPTTHILKPSIKHKNTPGSVENEYFCMTLARMIGLKTAFVKIEKAGSENYLLVTRYDRVKINEKNPNNEISRVHQEDFCQALGILSHKKYEVDGGPSLANCFQLIDKLTYPAQDKIELLKRVIFNFIVGNADCHAKNFSILHFYDKTFALAPFYDVLSTAVYPSISTKLAMSIGREADMNKVKADNWKIFCQKIDVSPASFKRLANEVTSTMKNNIPALKAQMKANKIWIPICQDIESLIADRIAMLEVGLRKM